MTSDTLLSQIQALQYTDQASAEALLLGFVNQTFPQLAPVAVSLRPSAVSLNSFNGTLTLADGRRLFFKTHVEPDSIVGEYYNSQLLSEAGYPIIRPLAASTEYGKQFLIYDLIDLPSVFDLARQLDQGPDPVLAKQLAALQKASDDLLFQIYKRTLAPQSAQDAAKAPVHQLFYHRLAGKRYRDFYLDGECPKLPLDKRWTINGRHYRSTLRDLIANQQVIQPEQPGISVIGHGDAHNGNLFYEAGKRLIFFDPAFAGRHHPLLDLAKPLFHNVFASWMYHPNDYVTVIQSVRETTDTIELTFDETPPGSRRPIFFDSKIEGVLRPLVAELRDRDQLPANWRLYLKMALFCCPLLTMNLTDQARFPEPIRWLGLAYAVIMGSESDGATKSVLDAALDEIEAR